MNTTVGVVSTPQDFHPKLAIADAYPRRIILQHQHSVAIDHFLVKPIRVCDQRGPLTQIRARESA
jgi:hypothetical protein